MKIDKSKFEICLANSNLLISELAQKSGVTKSSINLATNKQKNCRPSTIGKLSRALGVPVEAIIVKAGD